jgi:hypothetical protein
VQALASVSTKAEEESRAKEGGKGGGVKVGGLSKVGKRCKRVEADVGSGARRVKWVRAGVRRSKRSRKSRLSKVGKRSKESESWETV